MADRTQVEMGGSGTAKVAFTDALGAEVAVKSVQWSTTGAVALTPDAEDPTSASLFASGPGPSTITAIGTTDEGHTSTAVVEVMVVEGGAPVTGTITISASVPPARAKAKQEPPHQAHAGAQHAGNR